MPITTQSSDKGPRVVTIAYAHSGTDSYVILEFRDKSIRGEVQFPVSDLNQVLGISIGQNRETAQPRVEEASGQIVGYTRNHVSMSTRAGGVEPDFGKLRFLEMKTKDSYVAVSFDVDTGGRPPSSLTVEYDGIIADLPHRAGLLDARFFKGVGPLETFEREQHPFDGDTSKHTVHNRSFSRMDHLTAATAVGAKGLYFLGRRTAGKVLRAAGLRS